MVQSGLLGLFLLGLMVTISLVLCFNKIFFAHNVLCIMFQVNNCLGVSDDRGALVSHLDGLVGLRWYVLNFRDEIFSCDITIASY